MKKEEINNSMRLESYDLAKFAGELYALNGENINHILEANDYVSANKVLAVGCGDSYCAAWAAEAAYAELAKVPMRGIPAIEVSRCYDSRDLNNSLLFGISSRGKTSRVIEAAYRVNELGHDSRTVAIVNFKVQDSQLEKECDKSIHVEMPVFQCGEYTEHAPCQRSYFSTTFTQMLLAIRMGEERGNYSAEKAEEYRKGIIEYAEKFDHDYMAAVDERMFELSLKWNDLRQYEVVGSGAEMPTVWFVAAKVVEAFGDIATYENTEIWLEVNRYAKDPETIGTVVVLDKDNKAFDLTIKAIETMKAIGRPTLVITDADASIFPEGVEVVQIPSTEYGWAKPIMQYCPVGFVFGYIKEMRGASFYRYGGENLPYRRSDRASEADSIANQPLVLVK